jgi:hypothetical protein
MRARRAIVPGACPGAACRESAWPVGPYGMQNPAPNTGEYMRFSEAKTSQQALKIHREG